MFATKFSCIPNAAIHHYFPSVVDELKHTNKIERLISCHFLSMSFFYYFLSLLAALLILPTRAFLKSLSSGASQFVGVNSHDGSHFVGSITHDGMVRHHNGQKTSILTLYMDDYKSGAADQNAWISSSAEENTSDWEEDISKRNDGTLWSSFDTSGDTKTDKGNEDSTSEADDSNFDDGEVWLDAIAAISANEVTFMNTEADRADKVRQMQEWGFNSESISSTLGVNTDESNEIDPENEMLEKFKEETAKTGFGMYLEDDIDPMTVESHTTVERDEETGDPVRTQMVYVDEHSCIGCYNCANVSARRSMFILVRKESNTNLLRWPSRPFSWKIIWAEREFFNNGEMIKKRLKLQSKPVQLVRSHFFNF